MIADLQREVLGHLVGVDNGTDSKTDLGLATQRCIVPSRLGGA